MVRSSQFRDESHRCTRSSDRFCARRLYCGTKFSCGKFAAGGRSMILPAPPRHPCPRVLSSFCNKRPPLRKRAETIAVYNCRASNMVARCRSRQVRRMRVRRERVHTLSYADRETGGISSNLPIIQTVWRRGRASIPLSQLATAWPIPITPHGPPKPHCEGRQQSPIGLENSTLPPLVSLGISTSLTMFTISPLSLGIRGPACQDGGATVTLRNFHLSHHS